MRADLRRQIADRAAELAVDRFQGFAQRVPGVCSNCGAVMSEVVVFPEELLELQHDIEDELYRELASVKA